MYNRINYYWIFIGTFLFHFGCTKDDKVDIIPRTVIVYMVADNDLSTNAYEDIDEIIEGVTPSLGNNKIIIYSDPIDANPQLIEVAYSNGGNKNIIRDYPEQNSLDTSIMKNVFLEIINSYPSVSYGLILWSHGTSWLPPNTMLKSFGVDDNKEMDIILLERSLPLKFEFIIFDACSMGSIEVAYQLRNKANYILSSPTEILSAGYPYQFIISDLFGGVEELKNIAFHFFNYYNLMKGAYQSASISLIATKDLALLAEKNKYILTNAPLEKWNYNSQYVQNFDTDKINVTFDYLDFLMKNYPAGMVEEVKLILNNIVISKYHTQNFLNKFQIISFCGLSCYIPNNLYSNINNYYTNLSWYTDAGYDNLY